MSFRGRHDDYRLRTSCQIFDWFFGKPVVGSTPICLLFRKFLDHSRQASPLGFNTNNNANSTKQRSYSMKPIFLRLGRAGNWEKTGMAALSVKPIIVGTQTHSASENISLQLSKDRK